MTETNDPIQQAANELDDRVDIDVTLADLTETEDGVRLSDAAQQRAVATQHTEGTDATTD